LLDYGKAGHMKALNAGQWAEEDGAEFMFELMYAPPAPPAWRRAQRTCGTPWRSAAGHQWPLRKWVASFNLSTQGDTIMNDNVENLILEQLKGFRNEFRDFRSKYDQDISDVKQRLTTLERGLASLKHESADQ
jgi:hypothetical protein